MGGKTDVVKGRVKEAVGALTGNDRLRAEGKSDQAVGKVKQVVQTAVAKTKVAAQTTVRAAKETTSQVVNTAKSATRKSVDKAKEAAKSVRR